MVFYQIVYSSVAARPLGEQELVQLVEQARILNFNQAITGILFFSGLRFLHVLEGERGVVEQLYSRICQDQRHADVTLLLGALVPRRLFPAQSMSFCRVLPTVLARLIGYLDPQFRAVLLPRTCNAHQVMTDLLCEFVEEQTGVPVAWHHWQM